MNRNRKIKRTTKASRRQENKILRVMSICILTLLGMVAAIMIFSLFIWGKGQRATQTVDKGAADQIEQAEPLVIETTKPATEGSIRVFDYDGCCIYGYYGEIEIRNDGKDGKEIDIVCAGYLEGYQEHKEPDETGEREAENE